MTDIINYRGKRLPIFPNVVTYNKFFGVQNVNHWKAFFKRFDKKTYPSILDFGCGAAWSVEVGRDLGYNIFGLETFRTWCNFNEFDEFRKALGVQKYMKFYCGSGVLPFESKSFSLIVARASFHHTKNNRGLTQDDVISERIAEFDRILTGPRTIVIAGGFFLKYKKDFLDVGLRNVFVWHRGNKFTQAWK